MAYAYVIVARFYFSEVSAYNYVFTFYLENVTIGLLFDYVCRTLFLCIFKILSFL